MIHNSSHDSNTVHLTSIRRKHILDKPWGKQFSNAPIWEETITGNTSIEPRIRGNSSGKEHCRPRPDSSQETMNAMSRHALEQYFGGAARSAEQEE